MQVNTAWRRGDVAKAMEYSLNIQALNIVGLVVGTTFTVFGVLSAIAAALSFTLT